MALAHKAFRLPAMSYLKLPGGFSWTFFHRQNQSVKKSLLCEEPTRRDQGNFNPRQTWLLLPLKTEIRASTAGLELGTVPAKVESTQEHYLGGSLTLCIIRSKIYPQPEINF